MGGCCLLVPITSADSRYIELFRSRRRRAPFATCARRSYLGERMEMRCKPQNRLGVAPRLPRRGGSNGTPYLPLGHASAAYLPVTRAHTCVHRRCFAGPHRRYICALLRQVADNYTISAGEGKRKKDGVPRTRDDRSTR